VATPEGDSFVTLASSRRVPRAAGTAALQMDRSFDRERLGKVHKIDPATGKSESLEKRIDYGLARTVG